MSEGRNSSIVKRAGEIGLWLILPLVAGLLLAGLVPRPVVGLIYLRDEIYSWTASNTITQIAYAREHPEVRAVILVLDSPGGTAVDTEAIYIELARLRQSKPVIAVIESMAASGAYYLASGADYVYARPTSDVGNIGVISFLPPSPTVSEEIVSTGPYKLWGASRDATLRRMEVIKQGFYQAVQLGRGETLRAAPEIILSGEIWLGAEAARMGLVDELGTQSQAVERAARMAHIAHYDVTDLSGPAGVVAFTFFVPWTKSPEREPGLYLLYVPPSDRSGEWRQP